MFGSDGKQTLDEQVVRTRFDELATEISEATATKWTAESVAEGFLAIAVESMANAIKKISVQRGHDVSDYTLVCFGGAAGQHACLVADRLGIERVHVHPLAGVLSALGIGLADLRHVEDRAVEAVLDDALLHALEPTWVELEDHGRIMLIGQGVTDDRLTFERRISLKYQGADTTLEVPAAGLGATIAEFERIHKARFGFVSPQKPLIAESIHVEAIGHHEAIDDLAASPAIRRTSDRCRATRGGGHTDRCSSTAGSTTRRSCPGTPSSSANRSTDRRSCSKQPAPSSSPLVGEPRCTERGDLILERGTPLPSEVAIGTTVDPIQLEIFNNLFMNIAEQMGLVLENTAVSVNIKERLDFSCAIFDPHGDLIANAPHMPVHLGSMSESIKSAIRDNPDDAAGGRLRDERALQRRHPSSRHHHDQAGFRRGRRPTDLGRSSSLPLEVITPTSAAPFPARAPADSTSVEEEGVLLDNVILVRGGRVPRSRAAFAARRRPVSGPERRSERRRSAGSGRGV